MSSGRNRKKKKVCNTSNDVSPTQSGSESGLEEVELTQSDVEKDRTELGSPLSNQGPGITSHSLLQGSAESHDTTPLSHRRSERAKRRAKGTAASNESSLRNEIEENGTHNLNSNGVAPHSHAQHVTESGNDSNLSDLQYAHNAMKAEIVELKRDKRAYSSALVTQREKSEQMVKDLHVKTQQIEALEDALSRKKGGRWGERSLPWSLQSLSKSGIARYQGICLSAGKYGSKLAKLLITESFIDEKNGSIQKQDWTASATKISNINARSSMIHVQLPDGVLAVPVCNMVRALKLEFFTPRFDNSLGLLKASFNNVLEGPVGSYLSEAERHECISRVSSHRATIQKFKAIISDAVGSRKKTARNTYLKSLGYKYASLPDSKKDSVFVKDLRVTEKKAVLRRCVKENDENDTTYWRTSGWESLCLDSAFDTIGNEMNAAETELEQEGRVDNLFMNEAARRAFLVLRGYSSSSSISDEYSSDTSMLYLARADASMTTMLKFITLQGKGGSRNDSFVESFRYLLPKALGTVIKDIWSDLQISAPHELKLHIGNSSEDIDDKYGNNIRDWTVVQKNPDDNHIYLIASPKYFREKVCSWYGNVKDGHIGRYDVTRKDFVVITSSLSSQELEESDIEDDQGQYETIERSEL